MTPRPRRISVEIERLVLEGVSLGPGGADRVKQAATAALVTKLADAGFDPVLTAGGAHCALRGVPITLQLGRRTTPAAAMALGSRIGDAVGDRLSGRGTGR